MRILAIDQGTSATKAVLVGPGQEVLGSAEVPVRVRAVGGDGVEADPEELYASVVAAGQQALAAARTGADAVALANQGETVLAWDRRTGRPLTQAIVWQDRRSAGVCQRLAGSAERLTEITGLPLDPYFAAPKMTWLRENLDPGGVITTTDTWLLARLGAGYVTDAATASRTLLLDLDTTEWSAEACAAVRRGRRRAAARSPTAPGSAGETAAFGRAGAGRRAGGRPAGGAARRALLRRRAGQVHLRNRRVPAGHHREPGPCAPGRGLSSSVAWRLAGTPSYCLDGQVYTAGAAIRWLRRSGLLAGAAELDAAGGSRAGQRRRRVRARAGRARRAAVAAGRPRRRSSASAWAPPGRT